jgi:hypothetical protein
LSHRLRNRAAVPATALAVTLVVAVLMGGCSDDDGSCSPKPASAKIAGLADSFPLPPGSIRAGFAPKTGSYARARVSIPGDIDEFLSFVDKSWPEAGYLLTAGEHDEHDAEYGFRYPDGRVGALELREHVCREPWTELQIILR